MNLHRRLRRRAGFRMVYRHGDGWHWHANVEHRKVPPRRWTNAAGNTRWRTLGWLKAWASWARLRIGVER